MILPTILPPREQQEKYTLQFSFFGYVLERASFSDRMEKKGWLKSDAQLNSLSRLVLDIYKKQ